MQVMAKHRSTQTAPPAVATVRFTRPDLLRALHEEKARRRFEVGERDVTISALIEEAIASYFAASPAA